MSEELSVALDDTFRSSFCFCRWCGGHLRPSDTPHLRLVCARCNRITFLNPKVGVALLVEHHGALLLAKRREEPYMGWWTLPAGYVEYEESCEEAAVREGSEELSTRVTLQGLQGVYSYGDDPRSRMVLVVYRAACDRDSVRAGDDVSECRFFPSDGLPSNIAFGGVRDAIAAWVRGQQR